MDANARREVERVAQRLLAKVAGEIAADARRFAPVDTGELRASVHDEPVRGLTVQVWADAPYAGYVELGTRHMTAQAFLRPATYRKRGL